MKLYREVDPMSEKAEISPKFVIPVEFDWEAMGDHYNMLIFKYSDRSWRTAQLLQEVFDAAVEEDRP